MDGEQQNRFRGTLSQSVLEFFRDYGVDCTTDDPSSSDAMMTSVEAECEMGSVVGFRGANLRGGLAFVAPAALVARMLPVPADENRADLQLRDWSGEMANQLAGRFKNKLSREFDFDVGAAACFRGLSIQLSFLPNAEGMSVSFTIPSAGVRVYLDCSFDAEVTLAGDNASHVVPEGEVVLF